MQKEIERFLTALETIAAALSARNMTLGAPTPTGPAAPTASPVEKAAVQTDDLLSMPGETPVKTAKTTKKAAAAAAAATVTTDKPIELADVSEYVRKLVATDAKEGHKAAVSVLAKFGAKRISEVKPEDFPKIIATIEDLLKAVKK